MGDIIVGANGLQNFFHLAFRGSKPIRPLRKGFWMFLAMYCYDEGLGRLKA